jgi:hypothetical protein
MGDLDFIQIRKLVVKELVKLVGLHQSQTNSNSVFDGVRSSILDLGSTRDDLERYSLFSTVGQYSGLTRKEVLLRDQVLDSLSWCQTRNWVYLTGESRQFIEVTNTGWGVFSHDTESLNYEDITVTLNNNSGNVSIGNSAPVTQSITQEDKGLLKTFGLLWKGMHIAWKILIGLVVLLVGVPLAIGFFTGFALKAKEVESHQAVVAEVTSQRAAAEDKLARLKKEYEAAEAREVELKASLNKKP